MRHALSIFVTGLALTGLLSARVQADPLEAIINQFTLQEYQSYLRVLTGVDPVPVDPPVYLTNRYSFGDDIHIAAQWIHDHFQACGLDASLHTFDVGYGPNVIGETLGATRPDDIYLITAHFDTYHAADQSNAPGCDDNGSGTAAVMTAARILSQYDFEGTVRFIAFSGEEQWMVGSQAYAADAAAAGENIVAVINLDMILHPAWDNQDPDPDYDLDIGANEDSLWLAEYVAQQFDAYTPIAVQVHVNPDFVSDQWSFWQEGYDAVGLLENTPWEIWGGSNNSYHRLTDTMDNPHIDWEFAGHSVRGGMAGLVGLAGVLPVFGDWDEDGDVDLLDFEELLNCDTGPGGGNLPGCDVFDFDDDDDVDWADFAEFQTLFTGPR